MGNPNPEHSTLAYCEACDHVTSHDTSNQPPTCHVCAIRLIGSLKKDEPA